MNNLLLSPVSIEVDSFIRTDPSISYGRFVKGLLVFFMCFLVVKLSACRDHNLRGILTFLTIPIFDILTTDIEYSSIGNEGVF